MKTNKWLSSFLTAVLVLVSLSLPTAAAESAAENVYTVKYLDDNFIRIENSDTAFTANTSREYAINIPAAGSYAVFIKQSSVTTSSVGLCASFTQSADVTGGEALSCSIGALTDNSAAYKYDYTRIGAAVKGNESGSVALCAGACTFTLTSDIALTISYIDIKCVNVELNGGKRAVYPSDYTTYSKISNIGHVNSQISKSDNLAAISGYDYWGDLSDTALSEPWSATRQIHIENGTNAQYTFNVTKAGDYYISVLAAHYSWGATSASNDRKGSVSFYLNNDEFYKKAATIPHTGTSDLLSDEWHYSNKVHMDAGVYTFKIASTGFGTYIKHILLEEADADNKEYVLAQEAVTNYVNSGRILYTTEAYQDYTTSVIDNYVTNANDCYDRPLPVTLRWDAIDGASSYTLLLSTSEDFDDEHTVTYENITGTVLSIYNLLTNTSYRWKVQSDTNQFSDVKQFTTADTVRWIYADGIRNVRDLGGWNGLKQGLVFRGSEMNLVGTHGLALTEDGKKVLQDDLGIKTDLDFRQITADDIGDITESPIGSDVSWQNKPIGNYLAIVNEATSFKSVMELFAVQSNYPIYMHCWGGADRTGAVAFILEGLCGATETDLAIDFELTSFASFGKRYRYDYNSYLYASMLAKIKTYEGSTLQEKFENYALTTLGLTEAQVASIQSILSDSGSNHITVDFSASTATFELCFEKQVTGTVITALYCGKELVGIAFGTATDLRQTVQEVTYCDEPDSAKVMVWKDLNQIEPLTTALTYTTDSSEWCYK